MDWKEGKKGGRERGRANEGGECIQNGLPTRDDGLGIRIIRLIPVVEKVGPRLRELDLKSQVWPDHRICNLEPTFLTSSHNLGFIFLIVTCTLDSER